MYYIVTVYDSLNYGSFFQAKALKMELEKYGDVKYIDVHHQNIFKQTLLTCTKKMIKLQFKSLSIDYKNYLKIKNSQVCFNTISNESIKMYNPNDIVFFGSDEIWNVRRDKMLNTNEFFGINIDCKNKVSLAVSINDSTVDDFQKHKDIIRSLNSFTFLSVRDLHSENVINKLTNRNVSLVGDPTLIHEKEVYYELKKKISYNNYILIYSYGRMLSHDLIEQFKELSRSTGLKLLSVGRYFEFCDINVSADPYEFFGYIDNANYVFTDTFHGLMFSLIFEKQFIIFPCGNTKVESTLKYLNITDRLFNQNKDIDYYLHDTINYNELSKNVKQYGNKTRLFIENVIRSANNDN